MGRFVWIGSLFALLFPVGIPAQFLTLLYRHQRKGRLQDPEVVARFGFLYAKYEPNCWWWECAQLGHRLLLSSVMMFLLPGTASQIAMGMLLCLTYAVLQIHVSPFSDVNDDRLNFVTQLVTFLVLWGALLVKLDIPGQDGWSTELLSPAFVGLMMLPVILCLVLSSLPCIRAAAVRTQVA